MVRKAAGYLVRNGPVTQQDRWEEDEGYSPFTLAAEIAGLLAAAEIAEQVGEKDSAEFLRQTADSWNDNIERWCYAVGTELADQLAVEGYYVRIAPPESIHAASPWLGLVPIKNRPADRSTAFAAQVISPDSLALVRFGLRAPDDPRIVNTVKVIDSVLRVELPEGPYWYRYNGDGYGEHEDGSPFDGTGVGRPWPLLAGERAHYELAAGRVDSAEALAAVIEHSTDGRDMISEQVWDSNDISERELFRGKPSGSVCPLVWAHAEYVKLRRSLLDGDVFDRPPQPVERYLVQKKEADYFDWRFNNKVSSIPEGLILRVVLCSPALVHWSFDGWKVSEDTDTVNTGFDVHIVDLPTAELPPGTRVLFTFYWSGLEIWEGEDFEVVIEPEEAGTESCIVIDQKK
jgi:glucoamylase